MTPIYLMVSKEMTEAAAIASQLPIPAIKRLIFDCSDHLRERELSLEYESSEYNQDLRDIGINKGLK